MQSSRDDRKVPSAGTGAVGGPFLTFTNVAHKPERDAGLDDVKDLFEAFDKRWGKEEWAETEIQTWWQNGISAMTRDHMRAGWLKCKDFCRERPTFAQFMRACISGHPFWRPGQHE